MSNEEPVEGKCNAKTRDGKYCAAYPVGGANRCRMHGGTNQGPDPENMETNGNAETHGGYADAEKWFERHREEVEDDVRRTVAGWMSIAPFGWEVTGNVTMLVEAAINEQQLGNLNDYIDEHGEIVETVVDTDADGDPIFTEEENPAFSPKSRLSKDTTRILNKLGILDSPESEQADATQTLVDVLSDTE